MSGWIKLHRSLLDSQIFASEKGLKIWVWILLKANHSGKFTPIKIGKGETVVKVERGSFIFGRFKAEEALNIDGSTIYKWIKKMEEMGMVEIQSNSHYTILTVCKYNEYNDLDDKEVAANEQPLNNQVATIQQPCNTNNNDKNVNNDKNNEDNITPLPSFSEKPKKEERVKTWKDDYNIYLEEATDALAKLKQDADWMSNQEKFNPNILIVETLDKSFYNYWGTEAGWKNKKRLQTKDINWKSTYANAMSNPVNKVYKPKDNSQPTTFYKNSKGQLLHETEWIENGKRYYGKRGGKCYEVPMDLEPRPSTQYSLSFSQAMQCKVWVIN